MVIIPILVGVVYGYGKLNNRVETLETQAKEFQETKETVIKMAAQVDYIEKAVERIESKINSNDRR